MTSWKVERSAWQSTLIVHEKLSGRIESRTKKAMTSALYDEGQLEFVKLSANPETSCMQSCDARNPEPLLNGVEQLGVLEKAPSV